MSKPKDEIKSEAANNDDEAKLDTKKPKWPLMYHQSTVHNKDVNTLNPRFWLNDSIITFAYEYYNNVLFKDISKNIGYIHSATLSVISMMLSYIDVNDNDEINDLKDSFIGANLNKSILFIPINDGNSTTKVSGSHWSLMIYENKNNTFYYIDSVSGNGNYNEAIQFIKKHFKWINKFFYNNKLDKYKIIKRNDTPKQTNGYDCGMYLIENSRIISQYYVNSKLSSLNNMNFSDNNLLKKYNINIKMDGDYMKKQRKYWIKIINDMASQTKSQE